MPNFYIRIDEKFDELITKAKISNNIILLNDIISLKSFIYEVYMKDNEFENEYLRKELSKIELNI